MKATCRSRRGQRKLASTVGNSITPLFLMQRWRPRWDEISTRGAASLGHFRLQFICRSNIYFAASPKPLSRSVLSNVFLDSLSYRVLYCSAESKLFLKRFRAGGWKKRQKVRSFSCNIYYSHLFSWIPAEVFLFWRREHKHFVECF